MDMKTYQIYEATSMINCFATTCVKLLKRDAHVHVFCAIVKNVYVRSCNKVNPYPTVAKDNEKLFRLATISVEPKILYGK